MRRDQFIDFFHVAPHQQEMHRRLENWARSLFGGGGGDCSPMFRLYRPDNYERPAPSIPVDQHDAIKIGQGVSALPDKHCHALNWNYVYGGSPMQARKKIGCTMEGLMQYITDARQMLINRKV